MWSWFKKRVEWLLQIPPAPGAPPGDESSTRVFRASPRFYLYRLVGWFIARVIASLVILSGAAAVFMTMRNTGWIGSMVIFLEIFALAMFVAQTLISYAALRLDYEKRWYLVTDHSLRIREGVVNVSEMTITFANIQNISISQGPIERLFGISNLRVDTAGGAGHGAGNQGGRTLHTAFFQGVDNSEQIRELMQSRLRELKDSGLGDLDDRVPRLPETTDTLASQAALEVLREIHAEARELRLAVSGSTGS